MDVLATFIIKLTSTHIFVLRAYGSTFRSIVMLILVFFLYIFKVLLTVIATGTWRGRAW